MRIVVTAEGHPVYDDWVVERAVDEAKISGLVLGDYKGLVDERDTTGLYYHLFVATPAFFDRD